MLKIINISFALHTLQGTSHSIQWIQNRRVSVASLHSGFISRAMDLRSNFSGAGNSRSVGSSLTEQKKENWLVWCNINHSVNIGTWSMTVLLHFIGLEFFKFNALYAGLRLGKVERAGHLHHFALILAPSTWLTDIRLLTSSRVVLWRPCYSLYYYQRPSVPRVLSGSRNCFEIICKWRHIARPAEQKKALGD